MRVTRSSVLEVMHEDYVRTARAKGLTENIVRVLPDAVPPVDADGVISVTNDADVWASNSPGDATSCWPRASHRTSETRRARQSCSLLSRAG